MTNTTREARHTATPETPAPDLICPICDRPLEYRHSIYNGIKPIERWDWFTCVTCGAFEYRHRTRRLRPVSK